MAVVRPPIRQLLRQLLRGLAQRLAGAWLRYALERRVAAELRADARRRRLAGAIAHERLLLGGPG